MKLFLPIEFANFMKPSRTKECLQLFRLTSKTDGMPERGRRFQYSEELVRLTLREELQVSGFATSDKTGELNLSQDMATIYASKLILTLDRRLEIFLD